MPVNVREIGNGDSKQKEQIANSIFYMRCYTTDEKSQIKALEKSLLGDKGRNNQYISEDTDSFVGTFQRIKL